MDSLLFKEELNLTLDSVSSGEHELLGYIFVATVMAFFAIALPGYWLIRRIWPESGWNLGGSVSISAIRAFDLVVVGGFILMFALQWKMAPEMAGKLKEATAGSVLGGSFFFLILAALIPGLLYWRTNLTEYFGLRWQGWQWIFLIAPVFVIMIFIMSGLLVLTGWQQWVEGRFGGGIQDAVTLFKTSQDSGMVMALVVSAVLVAPIAEEVIFRGYIYPVVKCFSEKWFAGLFSAMLFGVVHMNLMGFPMLVVIGLGLVLLYEVTGSLWPSIACHMAFNATTVGVILVARMADVPLN